jgi:stage II sporulation protein D
LVSVSDSQCTSTDGTFWGHGVGLSGCGAETLAEEGKTFEEIIKTYYTGVEITKL